MPDFLNTNTWITKDGRELTAKQMTDSHLLNLMSFLQKTDFLQKPGLKRRLRIEALESYLNLPEPHGDGACMAYEEELNRATDFGSVSDEKIFRKVVRPSVLWRSLVSEADRRGLKHSLIFNQKAV